MIALDELLADFTFFFPAEQYAMRQNDGHNAVAVQVIEIMQQEGKIGLGAWCQAKASKARI